MDKLHRNELMESTLRLRDWMRVRDEVLRDMKVPNGLIQEDIREEIIQETNRRFKNKFGSIN